MRQVEAMSGNMSEEQKEATRQQIESAIDMQMEMMNLDVTIDEDGSFRTDGMMGMEPSTMKGTWKIEGEKIVFRQTHMNGEETEEAPEMSGTFQDGTLRLNPPNMPVELILRKK